MSNSAGVNMGGLGNVPLSAPDLMKCLACHCDKCVDDNPKHKELGCARLGSVKHDCCERQLQAHRKKGNSPTVDGEHGYNLGPPLTGVVGSRLENVRRRTLPRGSLWPDAAALDANGNVTQFFDFKFRCRKAKKPGNASWVIKKGYNQYELYKQLSKALGGTEDPEVINNLDCDKVADCPEPEPGCESDPEQESDI